MNVSKLFWGITILLLGMVFLGVNIGLLPTGIWETLWQFWPLLLVFWGVAILFSRGEKGGWFIAIISILIITLVGTYIWWNSDSISHNRETKIVSEELLRGTQEAKLTVKFGAAELKMQGGSDKLVSGQIDSYSLPDVAREEVNGKPEIVIDQLVRGPRLWGDRGKNNILDLMLSSQVSYDIVLNTGASKINLDLSDVRLGNLDIDCGASSGDITIGRKQAKSKVTIDSGASSFIIKIPKDYGIRVKNDSGLTSNNFSDVGLEKKDDYLMNSSYLTSENQVDLELRTGASSIKIELY
ncbi:hypothetical protein A2215_02365 [Candidatus Berkelbacteria bacterium RIFOXYA2_FULL_43_10]|uniref:Uncharacterized protein n=1 Tax=Candidatus Berkelbacteria bacterium RIFOXYA2_FULL_43_10 TaxID=1797472 RepID=A0A1F5E5Z8_9BACT|nr:MAG: hypothetical protein A2215_02365 [Candidatus Berkelbacteria bacterium RIFOXYA2_FULL_43_10]